MSWALMVGKMLIVVYGPPVFWFFLASYLDASRWEAVAFAAAMWALGLHFNRMPPRPPG